MQKLLTIVVPVYKVEPYINKCLDSCLIYKTDEHGERVLDEEMMNRLEVVIVNDGTPDNSAEMSREYVKRYPGTFRQIDKENGGHGSAWNVGLKEATGKYLRFLDSDDWLSNLQCFMHDLQESDADLVMTSYDTHFVAENKIVTTPPKPVEFGQEALISSSMWGQSEYGYNNVNFWTVTYKTSILKPLQPLFAEKVMFDDYIVTWTPLVHGRTYKAFDYVLYNYLVGRPNQSMSATQSRKAAHSYWTCFKKYEEVRSRIEGDTIPADLLSAIDSSITGYARYVFWHMLFFPYSEARERLRYLWVNYLKNGQRSAVMKRYEKLPFPLFYCVEHLRNRKNSK